MIKVAIVDDHKMFREGVRSMVEKDKGNKMIWGASNSKEAMDFLRKEQPDVLLMDISIGFESGVTLTKVLMQNYPNLKIIALTMHHEEAYIVKVLENGAKGYLIKDAGTDEMLRSISTVANGDTYYCNHVSNVLVRHITKGTSPKVKGDLSPLTKREKEILILIAREYSNPEIAKELFISIRTVDTHRRNLLDKLQVKNTAGLVKNAIKMGLLDIEKS